MLSVACKLYNMNGVPYTEKLNKLEKPMLFVLVYSTLFQSNKTKNDIANFKTTKFVALSTRHMKTAAQ